MAYSAHRRLTAGDLHTCQLRKMGGNFKVLSVFFFLKKISGNYLVNFQMN